LSKDELRYVRREEELRRTFRMASTEMECPQNFEQAEIFIERIISGKRDIVVLSSSFKKVK
jgi:acetyl/propionyl-CoA carboxylase alpha subunit